MLLTRETFREIDVGRSCGQDYKVLKIYPKKGTNIFPKRRLCEVQSTSGECIIIKAKYAGIVTQVLINVDDTIEDGCDILELEACTHNALMGNICCDCGVVFDEKDLPKTEAVSMLHSVPDLKIARNEAQKLGKEDIRNLLKQRRLVLLVDLDQTLIHTTNDNIPANLKDVYHFQINYGGPWYHARLRPHTKVFLEKVSKYYELHISTFGVREYAHHIAHFLDPDRLLFGQRILSRNECLDMMSKKANLDSLFPCGDNLVCIIDDRTDVWNLSPNVVQVIPYHFFRHTGDINAPQGLQKKENDDREGIDFKDLKKCNIKTVGVPTENTLVTDEDDKKSYSSDSDSDKDGKELIPGKMGDVFHGNGSETAVPETQAEDSEKDTKAVVLDTKAESGEKDTKEVILETKAEESETDTKAVVLDTKAESGEKDTKEVVLDTKAESGETDTKDAEPEIKLDSDVDSSKQSDDSVMHCDTELTEGNDKKPSENSDSCTSEPNQTECALKPDSVADRELTADGVEGAENTNTECNEVRVEDGNAFPGDVEMAYCKTKEEDELEVKLCDRNENDVTSSKKTINADNVFDVEDTDDYLLYLEDILKKIHKRFFKEYDKTQNQNAEEQALPDLKTIVPTVRREVLKGVNIVFSGVVPQQMRLQESKAYMIAVSYGAMVSERLIVKAKGAPESDDRKNYTTHVVAANLHTEKVNYARKHKSIKVVTPNWLWKCAERWELVEERLFPLSKETEKEIQRLPPHHCFTPDLSLLRYNSEQTEAGPSGRTRTASGSLMEEYITLTDMRIIGHDDKNNMSEEVQNTLSDDDESDDDEGDASDGDTSTTNGENDEEEDEEEGPRRKRSKSTIEHDDLARNDEEEEMENEDELPSVIFRQGGGLPSDDSDDGESEDEGNLSQMGADLESLLD
ncbi:RNA polymerase II subunit A C-terminal domain phosphatase-like isoform X2 [Homarus americanus]